MSSVLHMEETPKEVQWGVLGQQSLQQNQA